MLITYNQEQKITLKRNFLKRIFTVTEFTDTGHSCRS